MILGELGYRERLLLTAIGDAVHVAARLQELTKECGSDIQYPGSFSYLPGFQLLLSVASRHPMRA